MNEAGDVGLGGSAIALNAGAYMRWPHSRHSGTRRGSRGRAAQPETAGTRASTRAPGPALFLPCWRAVSVRHSVPEIGARPSRRRSVDDAHGGVQVSGRSAVRCSWRQRARGVQGAVSGDFGDKMQLDQAHRHRLLPRPAERSRLFQGAHRSAVPAARSVLRPRCSGRRMVTATSTAECRRPSCVTVTRRSLPPAGCAWPGASWRAAGRCGGGAERFQVSHTTAKRWADPYRLQGWRGMHDRSSRPHHSPHKTPARVEEQVIRLRQEHRIGPQRIAIHSHLAPSTRSLDRAPPASCVTITCPRWPHWTGPPAGPSDATNATSPVNCSTSMSRSWAASPTAAVTACWDRPRDARTATKPNWHSYDYDPSGNTIARTLGGDTQKLSWDAEGHLAEVSAPDQNGKDKVTQYLYDTEGNRLISRTPTGTHPLPGPHRSHPAQGRHHRQSHPLHPSRQRPSSGQGQQRHHHLRHRGPPGNRPTLHRGS